MSASLLAEYADLGEDLEEVDRAGIAASKIKLYKHSAVQFLKEQLQDVAPEAQEEHMRWVL